MKTRALLAALILAPCAIALSQEDPLPDNIYALQAKSIDGKSVSLEQYKGKVALIVNTASKCGFTPQYKALQALYDKYKDSGFVVLGFPSNDFLRQEPGGNAEIKKFCELRYGVTFPLFEKGPVKGKDTQPVFKHLKSTPIGGKDGEIGWNFTKFLIDQDGRVAARFGSMTKPDSAKITSKIEALLRSASAAAPQPRSNRAPE